MAGDVSPSLGSIARVRPLACDATAAACPASRSSPPVATSDGPVGTRGRRASAVVVCEAQPLAPELSAQEAILGDQQGSAAAQVIELRFFAEEDAAKTLDTSVATLKRDWDFGRTWLASRLKSVDAPRS